MTSLGVKQMSAGECKLKSIQKYISQLMTWNLSENSLISLKELITEINTALREDCN